MNEHIFANCRFSYNFTKIIILVTINTKIVAVFHDMQNIILLTTSLTFVKI